MKTVLIILKNKALDAPNPCTRTKTGFLFYSIFIGEHIVVLIFTFWLLNSPTFTNLIWKSSTIDSNHFLDKIIQRS